jgi:hypothetical protein
MATESGSVPVPDSEPLLEDKEVPDVVSSLFHRCVRRVVSGAFAVFVLDFGGWKTEECFTELRYRSSRYWSRIHSSMLLKCCCGTAAACRYQNDQEERTGTHRYHGETEGWRMDLSKARSAI